MLSKEEALLKAKQLSYGWNIGNNEFLPLKDVNKLIREIYSIKPYKFEELKSGMWLWNDKRKRCFRLTDTFIRVGTKYYRWLDISTGKLVQERFIENVLFPLTKAMEYQMRE